MCYTKLILLVFKLDVKCKHFALVSNSILLFYRNRLALRDCNPGLLFQSRDFGIEKCQSRIPGLNPLTVLILFWSHDEFLNLDLSAGVLLDILLCE